MALRVRATICASSLCTFELMIDSVLGCMLVLCSNIYKSETKSNSITGVEKSEKIKLFVVMKRNDYGETIVEDKKIN